jgi:hypothetical protein
MMSDPRVKENSSPPELICPTTNITKPSFSATFSGKDITAKDDSLIIDRTSTKVSSGAIKRRRSMIDLTQDDGPAVGEMEKAQSATSFTNIDKQHDIVKKKRKAKHWSDGKLSMS